MVTPKTAPGGPGSLTRREILLRMVIAGLAGLALLVVEVQPANARAPFATIAIDARSGEVLYARSADARRFPASLTKIMTLYLLFEDLEAGKISLDTRLKVSRHGAGQPPSKLGLKPGRTIRVRDAIAALVTKSANDVAATVAENLSGSEPAFAARMTRKARALGMTRTTFKNASGLPNGEQVTTARDMATLGLRIHKDFPKYYKHFAIRSYAYGKRRYRNHNRLLGRVSGVDGIKTGYTRASGYNLVTSARRGSKRVIAVVIGARSGKSRNRYMTALVNRMFRTKRLQAGSHLADVAGTPPGYGPSAGKTVASAERNVDLPPLPRRRPGSQDDLGLVVASTQPVTAMAAAVPEKLTIDAIAAAAAAPDTKLPDAAEASKPVKADMLRADSEEIGAGDVETARAEPFEVVDAVSEHGETWNIQIGAFPTADGAKSRLQKAMEKAAGNLRGKQPFTMKISKGSGVLYRARFSGFTRSTAKNACRTLTKKGLGCFALAPRS